MTFSTTDNSSSSPAASLSAPSRWLASELAALLSTPQLSSNSFSPHVPPSEAAPAADLFSARFNDIFIRHARGLVGGREVDREELKHTLLVLQQFWGSASACRFADCELHRRIEGFHPEMGVRMEVISPSSATPLTLTWEACVAKQRNGAPRIKTLMLDGDLSQFRL